MENKWPWKVLENRFHCSMSTLYCDVLSLYLHAFGVYCKLDGWLWLTQETEAKS